MTHSPLDRLVGTWEFEPVVDGRPAGTGQASFEPIEGGAFVVQRSEADWTDPGWAENAPRTTQAVIGWDDSTDEVVQLYADDRGVARIYRGRLTDDEWRLERAAPGFHQRFIGAFGDDGATIEGRWESSPDGTTWELDFPITYRKVTDETVTADESAQTTTDSQPRGETCHDPDRAGHTHASGTRRDPHLRRPARGVE